MLCPNCGREVPETRQFCPYCLKTLQTPTGTKTNKPTTHSVKKVVVKQSKNDYVSATKTVSKTENSNQSSKSKILKIIKFFMFGEGGWLGSFSFLKFVPTLALVLTVIGGLISSSILIGLEEFGASFLMFILSPVVGLFVWGFCRSILSPLIIFIESIAKMAKYED